MSTTPLDPAAAPGRPVGTPTQATAYYLQLAIAQGHCALAMLAVNDTDRLREHLRHMRAAIQHAELIR